jgi:hypothetical protein
MSVIGLELGWAENPVSTPHHSSKRFPDSGMKAVPNLCFTHFLEAEWHPLR